MITVLPAMPPRNKQHHTEEICLRAIESLRFQTNDLLDQNKRLWRAAILMAVVSFFAGMAIAFWARGSG